MRALLSNAVKLTLVQAALADGSTDPDSTAVDMSGFDGVLFVGVCGTITGSGTATLTAQQSDDAAVADDYTALTGATAAASGSTDSDKLVMLDVYNPTKRYVRVNLTRATANSVWGGTIAIQYKAKDKAAATAAAQLAAAVTQVISPAEAG
jgi:hypothetical protein